LTTTSYHNHARNTMPTRNAKAVWEGKIRDGKGSVEVESGTLKTQYNFSGRFENGGGSNPEELLAAAEAACFSMALSGNLERAGSPATRIETAAACTVDRAGDGFKVTTMKLTVRATVPGMDDAKFQEVAEKTKQTCPISLAILGNVDLQMDAKLA
jgi:osmotically inducible protein OsmC